MDGIEPGSSCSAKDDCTMAPLATATLAVVRTYTFFKDDWGHDENQTVRKVFSKWEQLWVKNVMAS